MKREQLEELGFIVKAELADEDIGDYLFVVEDQGGIWLCFTFTSMDFILNRP